LEPPLVSPPQYKPANSTVAPGGSDNIADDESNDPDAGHAAPRAGTFPGAALTYCMSYPLLSNAALLPLAIGGVFRAAVHPAADAGHTINVFAANAIFPISLTLNRGVTARSANAGDANHNTSNTSNPSPSHARRPGQARTDERGRALTQPTKMFGSLAIETPSGELNSPAARPETPSHPPRSRITPIG